MARRVGAVISLIVLILAAWYFLATRLRRMFAAERVVAISSSLFLEGRSEDPRIGDFAGFAFAKALPTRTGRCKGSSAHPI